METFCATTDIGTFRVNGSKQKDLRHQMHQNLNIHLAMYLNITILIHNFITSRRGRHVASAV